ncbi:MAG: hypothetical protein ACYC1L_13740 [Alphaproteobacteria bacterium]
MSYVLTVPGELIDRNPPVEPPLDETEAVRRYGRLLQASAGAARALGGLEGRFADETDWATAPDRFRAETGAIGRDFADSFGDDRTGRALFLRDFASLADARAAAFAGTSEAREREALQTAYADRMAGLSEIARGAEGPQRDGALRQAALEAHRAHAFGLESDPAAAVERFAAEVSRPLSERQTAPDFGWGQSVGGSGQATDRNTGQFGVEIDQRLERDAYERALNVRGANDAPTIKEVLNNLGEAKEVLSKTPGDVEARQKYDQAVAQLESRIKAMDLALTILAPFVLPAGAGVVGALGSFATRQTIMGILNSELQAAKAVPTDRRSANSLQLPNELWELGESP